MALASQVPKSAEPPASALVPIRPLRGISRRAATVRSRRGVGQDAADQPRGGSPPCAAATARPAPMHDVPPAQAAGEHGRRRAVCPDPAARDRGRARRAARRRRGRGPHRTRSRGWTAASRNPNDAVYRARAMRTLGATGLPVSPLGLGLAALGRPGLHQPRPRRRPRRRPTSRRWSATPTRCSTPPTTGGVRYFDAARSYGRAEEFLALVARRRGARARRRHGRLEVGLHLHRRLAGRRRRARGQGPLGRARCAASSARRARCSASTSRSTRSTRPRSRAACSRTRRCSRSSRACARRASAIGLTATGPRQAETIERAARGRRLRRRAGDLEPARALGRRRARPPRTRPGWA